MAQASINDLQKCKDACTAMANCVALDFSSESPAGEKCWLHTNQVPVAQLNTVPGVNHYIIKRCGSGRFFLIANIVSNVNWYACKTVLERSFFVN